MSKSILVIHPQDRTTNFLRRVKSHLYYGLPECVHLFNIKHNDESHIQCLDMINSHSETGLIIFLGHGRTDGLAGSKADHYHNDGLVSPDALEEHPNMYYGKEVFIDADNAHVFKGKKVFCLACNSNNKIGNTILESGAKSFLGFGNIPTSAPEFLDLNEKVTSQTVSFMKAEVNYIVKTALFICLRNGYSFEKLQHYINLITSQRISSILRLEKRVRDKALLTDYLYFFKSEIKLLGDKKVGLIE